MVTTPPNLGTVTMSDEVDTKPLEHWSSTFVRLRAESVVLGVLLLVITRLDLNLSKIPGLGIDLSHPAPKGWLLIALYGFWAYFLINFWIRGRVELAESGLPSAILNQFLTGFAELQQQLEAFTKPNWGAQIAEYHGALMAVQNGRSIGFLAHADQFEEFITKLEKRQYIGHGHVITGTSPDDLIRSSLDTDLTIDQRAEQIARAGELVKIQMAEWDSHLAVKLRDIKIASQSQLDQLDAASAKASEILKLQREAILETIDQRNANIEASLSKIRSNLNTLRREINNLRAAVTWDKIVFGWRIPLLFAALSGLLALPQALVDAKPTVEQLQICSEHPMSCLYR